MRKLQNNFDFPLQNHALTLLMNSKTTELSPFKMSSKRRWWWLLSIAVDSYSRALPSDWTGFAAFAVISQLLGLMQLPLYKPHVRVIIAFNTVPSLSTTDSHSTLKSHSRGAWAWKVISVFFTGLTVYYVKVFFLIPFSAIYSGFS